MSFFYRHMVFHFKIQNSQTGKCWNNIFGNDFDKKLKWCESPFPVISIWTVLFCLVLFYVVSLSEIQVWLCSFAVELHMQIQIWAHLFAFRRWGTDFWALKDVWLGEHGSSHIICTVTFSCKVLTTSSVTYYMPIQKPLPRTLFFSIFLNFKIVKYLHKHERRNTDNLLTSRQSNRRPNLIILERTREEFWEVLPRFMIQNFFVTGSLGLHFQLD